MRPVDFIMWLRFYRMNEIRKFNCILYKKYGNIITNKIKVAFLCVKFYRKTSYISCEITRAAEPATVENLTKTGVLTVGSCRNPGFCIFAHIFINLKNAMCRGTAGMYNPFRNTLMIKMSNFFAKMKIFEKGCPPLTGF